MSNIMYLDDENKLRMAIFEEEYRTYNIAKEYNRNKDAIFFGVDDTMRMDKVTYKYKNIKTVKKLIDKLIERR